MIKKYLLFITAVLLVVGIIFLFQEGITRSFVSKYLARQFEADVSIKKAGFNPDYSIGIEALQIKSDSGWNLQVDSGILRLSFLDFFKKRLNSKFELHDIKYSYIDSEIINRIFDVLSLAGIDSLDFLSAEGELEYAGGRFFLKSLHLDGNLVKIDAYGMADSAIVDYDITMLLSRQLTSGMPESVRKVFFRAEGEWFRAQLKVSGKRHSPSVDFRTDLFTLSVS